MRSFSLFNGESKMEAKYFTIKNTDQNGHSYYRSLTNDGERCWQPFESRAEIYTRSQVIELISFIDYLEVGESVSVERVKGLGYYYEVTK